MHLPRIVAQCQRSGHLVITVAWRTLTLKTPVDRLPTLAFKPQGTRYPKAVFSFIDGAIK